MPLRLGFVAGILCFCTICFLDASGILNSPSSTAAVGFVFLPLVAALLSIPGFAAGWCLSYFLMWRQSPVKSQKLLAIAAGLVPLILGVWLTKTVWDGLRLSQQVHRIQTMKAGEMESVLDQPGLAGNKFILGAIAQNPNATAAILHRIVSSNAPELHKPMGSAFDVMGKNASGLAVMRLVAMHAHAAPMMWRGWPPAQMKTYSEMWLRTRNSLKRYCENWRAAAII